MQPCFQQVYTIDGTLGANHTFQSVLPFDVQLVHASLCNTTANAGTLKIGTTSDDDAYLAAEDFGVSSVPTEVDTFGEFDGATAATQYPHIPADTVFQITVTDHASHMANVCVVLTFMPG